MLNEKNVIAVMKAAWKSAAGYKIKMDDEGVILSMQGAFAYIPRARLPRKVLALIVEHIGKIPGDFEAYCVSKFNGAQSIIVAMMEEELKGRKDSAGEAEEHIQKTRLTYGAWEIWQGIDSKRVFALDPDKLKMIDEKAKIESLVAEDMVLMIDDGEWVMFDQSMIDKTVRTHLEKFQWTGG